MSDLPVTIIGGYLGAGKTSLVNHLLRHAAGRRLAVLVNEFGALPIDADLIEADDGEMISIAGGCVCCAYGDNMARALAGLQALDPRPDHVVLEASGVALPGAIAGTVSLLRGFAVDGILVLADAETVQKGAADPYMGDTVLRQLRDADLVILNKTDLVPDLSGVNGFLLAKAPRAAVFPTRHGALPPEIALQSFDANTVNPSQHDTASYRSLSLPMEAPCDPQILAEFLASEDLALLRAKGFVDDETGQRHAIQCVGRRYSVLPAPAGVPLGLVCIGLAATFDPDAIRTVVAQPSLV